MDSYEATRTVFSRIQSLEPENASKIMGFLLIQEYGEKEMIRLAFGPETLLQNLIVKAKTQLGIPLKSPLSSSSPSSSSSPFNPISRSNLLSPSSSARISINNGFDFGNNPSSPSSNGWSNLSGSSPLVSYASIVNRSSSTSSGSLSSSVSSFVDEYPLQNTVKTEDVFDQRLEWAPMAVSPNGYEDLHKQSYSVDPNLYFGSDDSNSGFGYKPCLYFARGFCKNGSSCRFLHEDSCGDGGVSVGSPSSNFNELEQCHEFFRLKVAAQQQKLAAASPFMAASPLPYNKGMNLLMQQQIDTQRSAAAAALMTGDEFHKFERCRFDRNNFSSTSFGGNVNPCSRQIYLTFPADSTFREEDVSNYFSLYGPVQDVRIPYQQKRMFGFVTFVYPETVKIILAKGNPHFVCDSRVLVKPYKEKGKILDKKQQHQQQMENGDYSLCSSPSGIDYDNISHGPRMFYNTQEMLLMKKLEERANLQQAMELQGRRLMNLQLMDLKNHHYRHHDQYRRSLSSGSSIPSPGALSYSPSHSFIPSDGFEQETTEENNGSSVVSISQNAVLDTKRQLQAQEDNSGKEFAKSEGTVLNESNIEHILPDSLFASPKKSANSQANVFSTTSEEGTEVPTTATTTSTSNDSPSLTTSALNIASPKSVLPKCSGFLLGMEPLECS
ncbi:hypothetical protein UlMin_029835 [Ulmus minor]